MVRQRRDIGPTERIPMYHFEEVGGDSEAAVIEKPEGDFVIQTRDEEIPLDPEPPDPEIHVHVNVDLPGLVDRIAEIMRRKDEELVKAPGRGISSEEQSLRFFQEPQDDNRGAETASLDIPTGGRVQADNPALYVMRTGNDTLGKHDTPKSKHKDHGPKGKGDRREEPKLRRTRERADTGSVRSVKNKLSKREMGQLGERLAMDYLKGLGHDDAKLINVSQENFAIDGVADSAVFEVKAGPVSNGRSARHWRATLGQPGKREAEYLKRASSEEKREWNEQKQQAVIERKERAVQEISREKGHEVSGKTISFIVDPDRKVADVHVFDGFHRRIGWDGDQARDGYVGSYKYD